MRQLFIILLIIPFTLQQTTKLNGIEEIINSVIQSNIDLKEGKYVVFNELKDIDTLGLLSTIKAYNLNYEISNGCFLSAIDLELIDNNKLQEYNAMADTINKSIIDPFELKNKYRLIHEHLNKEYCEFTKPIFSQDKKIALIEFNVISGYLFGSHSETLIMRKIGKRWKVEDVLRFTED